MEAFLTSAIVATLSEMGETHLNCLGSFLNQKHHQEERGRHFGNVIRGTLLKETSTAKHYCRYVGASVALVSHHQCERVYQPVRT